MTASRIRVAIGSERRIGAHARKGPSSTRSRTLGNIPALSREIPPPPAGQGGGHTLDRGAIAFGAPPQALAQTTGSLTVPGVAPPIASILLSQSEARIPGDLRVPHSGEIVTITERSNVPFGYEVTVKSDTAAFATERAC